jgi:DNA-binding NarL/FixJ family response regulator
LLPSDELERFVEGMLEAGAMTAATLMRALRLRFTLEDDEQPGELDDAFDAGSGVDPQAEPVIAELVTATLAELTERQAKVLMGLEQKVPGRELAVELGCSTGTISHERSRIAEVLARLGADAPAVLKGVLDALFQRDT